MAILGVSIAVGLTKLARGTGENPTATATNVLWACYLLAVLSVILRALRHRPA
jgi:hypothetical protein